jgi:hypothetical protein
VLPSPNLAGTPRFDHDPWDGTEIKDDTAKHGTELPKLGDVHATEPTTADMSLFGQKIQAYCRGFLRSAGLATMGPWWA